MFKLRCELVGKGLAKSLKFMIEGLSQDEATAKASAELSAERERLCQLSEAFSEMLERLKVLEAIKDKVEHEEAVKRRRFMAAKGDGEPS